MRAQKIGARERAICEPPRSWTADSTASCVAFPKHRAMMRSSRLFTAAAARVSHASALHAHAENWRA
eukprot:3996582-Lingulodinium_polyedra.AAC.1